MLSLALASGSLPGQASRDVVSVARGAHSLFSAAVMKIVCLPVGSSPLTRFLSLCVFLAVGCAQARASILRVQLGIFKLFTNGKKDMMSRRFGVNMEFRWSCFS